MNLPKKIRFWFYKLKAYNYNQKIKLVILISAFWVSIIIAVVIWAIFRNTGSRIPVATLPGSISSINQVAVKEASPSIQVFLFTDANLLSDLPKEVNTKTDLDSLIKASQNTDLNIDQDLSQINY